MQKKGTLFPRIKMRKIDGRWQIFRIDYPRDPGMQLTLHGYAYGFAAQRAAHNFAGALRAQSIRAGSYYYTYR